MGEISAITCFVSPSFVHQRELRVIKKALVSHESHLLVSVLFTVNRHIAHPLPVFHSAYLVAAARLPTSPCDMISPPFRITTLFGPTYSLCRANHHAVTKRHSPPVISEV